LLPVISPSATHLGALFAAVAIAIVGKDRQGRPPTEEEKRRFDEVLREHDYSGTRLVALRFAFKLTKAIARAQELMSRVDVRLRRAGWDPGEVALASRLCRLTWSEWTHAEEEDDANRRVADGLAQDLEVTKGTKIPPVEQQVVEESDRTVILTKTVVRLHALREKFEAAGDTLNLAWLDAAEANGGKPDLEQLARATGRAVAEFHDAAKRRRRAVLKLQGEEHGVTFEEEA
jgi:hypothetical protein